MASVLGLQEQSIMPSKAFIDANFLLAMEGSNHRYHKACRDLVSKLSQKGTRFYISPLVIDEFYFAIISMTLRKKHKNDWYEKYKGGLISLDHELAERLKLAESFINKLTKTDIVKVCKDCTAALISGILTNNLLPADALHIKTMEREKIVCLLSLDSDFRPVKNITLFTNLSHKKGLPHKN